MARLSSIAFVTETFPPEIGGAAMCGSQLVAAARARGIEVRLYRPRGNGPVLSSDGLVDNHMPGFDLPLHQGLRLGFPCRRRLRAEWGGRPPDLVHVVTEGPLGLSAVRAARDLGIPRTSGFHTNFHAYSGYYGLSLFAKAGLGYLRRFHNSTHGTMVPTPQVQAQLEAQGFEGLSVVGRGVDTTQFGPAHRSEKLRSHWGASPSDPVALYVGRLAPEKNVPLALKAFGAIRARNPRSRLVVVGDGPDRHALGRMQPDAVFTGAIRGPVLSQHYASADLFLFPSLTETFGNVTLEAMASGLPVVAFDDGAARLHVRHLVNGALVPRADEAAFTAAALWLAERSDRLRSLGDAAAQTASLASWSAVGAAFIQFLELAKARARRVDAPGSSLTRDATLV